MELSLLEKSLADLDSQEALKIISGTFREKAVFTTSFGMEDQVITHMIFSYGLPVEVVTLDTGRLFPETYQVFNETLKKYGREIKVFFPGHEDVQKMVTLKGPFSFYYSVENRHECCNIRKSEPLARALKGKKCWISGIRTEQSQNRSNKKALEYNKTDDIIKYYPLFDWTLAEVKKYISENNIPYNVLHDKGFVSIGCQPCTRAIQEGEDFRAGRWWWENGSEKECGIHKK